MDAVEEDTVRKQHAIMQERILTRVLGEPDTERCHIFIRTAGPDTNTEHPDDVHNTQARINDYGTENYTQCR